MLCMYGASDVAGMALLLDHPRRATACELGNNHTAYQYQEMAICQPKTFMSDTENMRDGFEIDPIEVQIHPDEDCKYRILDGAHRFAAYKQIGATEIPLYIITLNSVDPLLYAAQKAIGPLQLSESEARETSRRAYQNNPRLSSVEIGRAVGRSRQTIDLYVADLRAVAGVETGIRLFGLHRPGLSQDRIAKIMGVDQKTIRNHLGEMPTLAFLLNSDLKRGFTVPLPA